MKAFLSIPILLMFCSTHSLFAQYEFSGYVDPAFGHGEVSLSRSEDYRKVSGIYPEQILQKTQPDTTGYFKFSGANLPEGNQFYNIHLENCSENGKKTYHFDGICPNSIQIQFIANNQDRVALPLIAGDEMFCEITSKNEHNLALMRIDSIKEVMTYAFGSYPSIVSKKMGMQQWFPILQKFGKQLDEPLAELYLYAFISNKSTELYAYYLEDLKTNPYYDALLARLQKSYPNSIHTQKYSAELEADKFLINPKNTTNVWLWIIGLLLIASVGLNFLFGYTKKRKHVVISKKSLSNLTEQEKKILALILENKTNKEIAASIFVSLSTVKTHINNLYKKLEVNSRDEVKSLYSNN